MNSPNFIVLLDANVLYPAPLRDLLLSLATNYIFRAKWSSTIHAEWKRNLLINRPDLNEIQIDKTIEIMNKAVPDCLVNGYETIASTLNLPDDDDRHVLAAAIIANAQTIITFNTKDFPQDQLKQFNIEAQHPDAFLLRLLNLDQNRVLSAIKSMRQRLKNPPKEARAFLDTLSRQNIPLFISEIEKSITLI